MVTRPPSNAIGSDGSVWAPAPEARLSHARQATILQTFMLGQIGVGESWPVSALPVQRAVLTVLACVASGAPLGSSRAMLAGQIRHRAPAAAHRRNRLRGFESSTSPQKATRVDEPLAVSRRTSVASARRRRDQRSRARAVFTV